MLKSFHDTWYAPNNAILVVVGDVDPQATLLVVKQLFGDIPVVLVSPDGQKLFASGSRNVGGSACLWDLADLKKPPRRLCASHNLVPPYARAGSG